MRVRVVGAEDACAALGLGAELGRVYLCEAFGEQSLAEECAHLRLAAHDGHVGWHAQVDPPVVEAELLSAEVIRVE